MSNSPVSIHPYFRAHPGKLESIKPLLQRFVERTKTEQTVLHYEFTQNGDEIFCRESYTNAEAALAHITNVKDLLDEILTMSDLVRLEFHGPEDEIAKLREPLAELNPAFFVSIAALQR